MRIRSLFLTTLLFIFVFPLFTFIVLADEGDNHEINHGHPEFFGGEGEDFEERYEDLQEKIDEYEAQIRNLQSEAQSLKRDISYMDTQISLTELRIRRSIQEIDEKTKQIDKLALDIEDLSVRIERLEDTVIAQEKVLAGRSRARYKTYETSPIVIFLGSKELSEAIKKTEYLKVLEKQDKKLLDEMEQTKQGYGTQRFLMEKKKDEVEALRAEIEIEKANLEGYRVALDQQKKDKEDLLAKTENDEQKYQSLLAQTRSELAALQLAINLPEGGGEDVEEGDVIGLMGNTGCSSGPHLHFGYVKNGKSKDPLPLLESGYLRWPVNNPVVTQYFGANYSFYMQNFGIPGHDAIDIADSEVWTGSPIRAAKDGVLYYAQDQKVYCPWLNNSLGKGAIIDHGDGERTIYWHMQ